MDLPLVSLIVPAYNHVRYIDACLLSLVQQTYRRIELILIDDGSVDGTSDRVSAMKDELGARFERFVHIRKPNEGVCRTLNRGVALAEGELIKYLASDDVLCCDAIERQVDLLVKRPDVGLCFTDGYDIDSGELERSKYPDTFPCVDEALRFSRRLRFVDGHIFDQLTRHVFELPSPTNMFRRQCLIDTGAFDENLPFEDPDMFLRVARKWPIAFVASPLAFHRIHAANSGRGGGRILPGVELMLRKFKVEFFDSEAQYEGFKDMMYGIMGFPEWELVRHLARGRVIVGWGTGNSYRRAAERWDLGLSLVVDSAPANQGTLVDGLEVKSPQAVAGLGPAAAFVAILSQFRTEIGHKLDGWGFVKGRDYL